MKSNDKIDTKIVSVNPKEKLVSYIGLALLGLLLIVVFAVFHIRMTHSSKINTLSVAKYNITSAHLEFEDIANREHPKYQQINAIEEAKNQLENFGNHINWVDKIMPLYTQNQYIELKSIFKQVSEFERLCAPSNYALNKQQHDIIFNVLEIRVTNLQSELNSTLRHQTSLLTNIALILFVLLLIHISFVLLYVRNFRKLRDSFLAEQQQLLETFKHQNYFLEASQNISKLGYYTYNFKTKKFNASKFLTDIMNLNSGEGDLLSWINIIHKDDRFILTNALNLRLIDATAPLDVTYRVINPKNGKIYWMHHVAHPLQKDIQGNLLPAIGILQDITETKLAEIALKESERELIKSQEIAQVGSYVLDLKTKIATCSKTYNQIIGFKSDEPKTFEIWKTSILHPDDAAENKKMIENCLKTGQKFEREYRIYTKDTRELKWLSGKGEFIFKDGLPTSFIETIQDITKQKLAEIELFNATKKIAESENRFREIFEKSGDAILIIKNGIFIDCNQATVKMLGYQSKDEFINTHPSKLSPKIQPDGLDSYEKAQTMMLLAQEKGTNRFVWMHTKKNGKDFPVEVLLTSISNEPNNQLIHCVWRDITERERDVQIKEVIYNITKVANSSPNLEKLFIFIKSELSKLINTNNFFIALYDKTRDMISTPYMTDEKDDGSDFPKGKTLTGYIIDTKKSLLASEKDLLDLENSQKIEIIGPLSKCWLGAPLIIEDKAIGAIVMQSYTDANAYSKKDVELLELIASNIGQVIKQARDFEKISLLNQALVQSPESVVVTSPNGEIEFANPAFINLSGYTLKEVIGKAFSLLKSNKQDLETYKILWKTIKGGKTWEGELINRSKYGKDYLVKANISPVKDSVGNITHFVLVEADITEKRKLERDFIHAFIDAQEQEKISFGEDLHDGISQILSAESMYVEVLFKLIKSDDKRIIDALNKIRSLNLSAITDARNIAHGLMSKQLKESGLIKAIEHICNDYNQSKKIVFNFKSTGLIEDDISKEIKINLFRITQEISTNIIRHSGAKNAHISLTKTEDNHIQLIVKDDGVGIDLEKMEREKKGAGSKNIERRVTLLNGKIKVDTAPNQGVCFTITVPLQSL